MLKVSDITKKFNDQTVLDRLSFSVKRGERIALTAPSGSGKTTLISILAGIDRDFSGKVTFNHKKKGWCSRSLDFSGTRLSGKIFYIPWNLAGYHCVTRLKRITNDGFGSQG